MEALPVEVAYTQLAATAEALVIVLVAMAMERGGIHIQVNMIDVAHVVGVGDALIVTEQDGIDISRLFKV